MDKNGKILKMQSLHVFDSVHSKSFISCIINLKTIQRELHVFVCSTDETEKKNFFEFFFPCYYSAASTIWKEFENISTLYFSPSSKRLKFTSFSLEFVDWRMKFAGNRIKPIKYRLSLQLAFFLCILVELV